MGGCASISFKLQAQTPILGFVRSHGLTIGNGRLHAVLYWTGLPVRHLAGFFSSLFRAASMSGMNSRSSFGPGFAPLRELGRVF